MKKHIVIEYDIEFCNARCPHFYFNFDDFDNCWCDKLNRRIFKSCGFDPSDCEERLIPEDCPLDNSKQ
jgi:hypothetical protein